MAGFQMSSSPRRKEVQTGLQMVLQVLLTPVGISLLGLFSPAGAKGQGGKEIFPGSRTWSGLHGPFCPEGETA